MKSNIATQYFEKLFEATFDNAKVYVAGLTGNPDVIEDVLLKTYKENGERVEYTQENLVDYLVTYEGVSITENNVLVVNNGTPLVAGQSLTINNRLFSGKAFVLSVEKSN